MRAVKKLLSAPWFIFLLVGGLGYYLYPTPTQRPLIYISDQQLDTYLDSYRQQFPRQYSASMEQRLVQQLIAEEALLQQAFRLNYENLPVVQDRLKKLGGFLEDDAASEMDDDALIDRAMELGLLQSDPVIRRYLVSVMERALVAGVPLEITDADIEAYYQTHQEEFERPPRLDLRHVFFSADKGRTAEYANAVREELLAMDIEAEPDKAYNLGDVFYSGHRFAGKNEAQLAAIFGTAFASEAFQQGDQQWSRAVRSAYGWHLLWLDQRRPAVVPEIESVKDKIIARIRQDKEKIVLEQQVEKLKDNFDIQVDGVDMAEGAS